MLRFQVITKPAGLVALIVSYMVTLRAEKSGSRGSGESQAAKAAGQQNEASVTTFDEREKAYEAQLAHDEELRFRALVRRNKLLGLWAAEKLGKSGAAAEDYAAALINIHLAGHGDDSVFAKLRADFNAARVALSDHQIRREMNELLAKAAKDVVSGAGASP